MNAPFSAQTYDSVAGVGTLVDASLSVSSKPIQPFASIDSAPEGVEITNPASDEYKGAEYQPLPALPFVLVLAADHEPFVRLKSPDFRCGNGTAHVLRRLFSR